MRKTEVPQDRGFSQGVEEIAYAVNEEGRYVLVQSRGWEPKTVANDQAWEVIGEAVAEAFRLMKAGKRSPIFYYMTRHMMGLNLLADYIGISRFRVWRHLRPGGFRRLTPDLLSRYADLFGVSVEQLRHPPDNPKTEAS